MELFGTKLSLYITCAPTDITVICCFQCFFYFVLKLFLFRNTRATNPVLLCKLFNSYKPTMWVCAERDIWMCLWFSLNLSKDPRAWRSEMSGVYRESSANLFSFFSFFSFSQVLVSISQLYFSKSVDVPLKLCKYISRYGIDFKTIFDYPLRRLPANTTKTRRYICKK